MSATITWVIEYMNSSTQTINGFSEVVLTAGWRCNGSETTTSNTTVATSVYGTASFPEPVTGAQFTSYNQLTQAQVLGWCYENGVNQAATEAAVTTQLFNLANPPVVQNPLPWGLQ
jgi:hypothetical protein